MSTVGSKTRLRLSEEGGKMAAQAQAGRGSKGKEYHAAVADLVAAGESVGSAIKQVASRTGTTNSNVSNAYYRIQKKSSGDGQVESRGTRHRDTPTVSVPKDLEAVLDALRKDRDSMARNIDSVIAWAQSEREKVSEEKQKAYNDTMKKLRAAAGLE